MAYNVYKSLHLHLARLYRRGMGVSKKAVRGRDMEREALELMYSDERAGMTIEHSVLADEESYEEEGRHVYFPEDEFLLRALWRAHMDVDASHLEAFPKCVTIAWPGNAVVEGAKLPPCLVWCGSTQEHHDLLSKMVRRHDLSTRIEFVEQDVDSDAGIHISWQQDGSSGKVCYRCSIPRSWLSSCLKSEKDLVSRLPELRSFLSMPLNVEENHVQYVLAKMVVHLFVYIQACPNAVVMGWPDRVGMRDFLHQWKKGANPWVISSPKGTSRSEMIGLGSHASPEPHWRTWHFRSFPLKRDGTKKAGTVFVRGTMVGGEVEPVTVIDVGVRG